MSDRAMLIKRIKAAGLLSFGPDGIDLPLHGLEVLIGPNGSGKSNLIELLALLQETPGNLSSLVTRAGGAQEWLWKGEPPAKEGVLEAVVTDPLGPVDLRHRLVVTQSGQEFEVADERIEYERALVGQPRPYYLYDYRRGRPEIKDPARQKLDDAGRGLEEVVRELDPAGLRRDRSILAQMKDPDPSRYPWLRRLQEGYDQIHVYRNWTIGPESPLRRPEAAVGRNDIVYEDFSNYQRAVWNLRKVAQSELLEYLRLLYEGAEDLHLDALGDTVLLSVKEAGTGYVPVTRISDGTLRYLCLLAILLNPSPPSLVVIDEPDLGLHPDLMPTLVKLLCKAAERTQVLITTHSRALVDAFSDRPGAVVVCGKDASGTFFERLDPEELARWLERYSLGQLWSRGEFGGNRW